MAVERDSKKTFFECEAFESQRASGFRNTAFALAELIDNAFDAEASKIKVSFFEKRDENNKKYIDEIVVADSGEGMSKAMVEDCLILGKSGHRSLDSSARKKKMGKFGYGLPNSSLSQCPCVYVYSWQKSDSIFRTYLDIEQQKADNSTFIPTVKQDKLPDHYLKADCVLNKNHGTIVSWRRCDRLSHSRAQSIIEQSAELLGRLYRYLLIDGKSISLDVYEFNEKQKTYSLTQSVKVIPNDPLFLKEKTYIENDLKEGAAHTHLPYAQYFSKFIKKDGTCKPTNEILKDHKYDWVFEWRQKKITFHISTTTAHIDIQKPGIREGARTPVGKRYGKKEHISFVRANREIAEGNFDFYLKTNPQHRWWSVEVKFDEDADALLGVHNNKQGIEFVKTKAMDETDDQGYNQHTATLQQARVKCWIELTKKIDAAVKSAVKIVESQGDLRDAQMKGLLPQSTTTGIVPESTTTTTNASLITDGKRESSFSEAERSALEVRLLEKYPHLKPEEIRAAVSSFDQRKVRGCVLYCPSESESLWSLTTVYKFLIVLVNTRHEFYKKIMAPLRNSGFDSALSAIELFLSSLAWEEYEHFSSSEDKQLIIEQFRSYVGLHLHRYITENQIEVHEKDFISSDRSDTST